MDPKNWTAVVNKKLLSLQNEINPFVVVWIVLMRPRLSKTAMKGKLVKIRGRLYEMEHNLEVTRS